jgi:FkbM family methyltransferase
MNTLDLANYYVSNKSEFEGEDGHEKLLVGLKKFVTNMNDTSSYDKIVGIDVGSCVGDYIKHLNDICMEENKKILCFEPNPVNILELEPKINQDKNLKLFKHCISNETTTASFYNWKDSYYNVAGNGIAGLRSGGEKICDIDVKKLEDVLDNEFVNENIIIKFIKIDTEGNDSNVIKGFEKYLPKTKYIIFECSNCLDDVRGPGIENPMKDIVSFLSKNGFDTYRIGTKKLFKVNDEYWNQVYDDLKFWSNCFSLKKDDNLIHKLINEKFDYTY